MTSRELDEINKQQEKRRMKGIPKGQTHRFAAKIVASRRAFNSGNLSGIYRKKWKGSQDIFAPIKSTKQTDIDRWKEAKRSNRMQVRAQWGNNAASSSSSSSSGNAQVQQGKVSQYQSYFGFVCQCVCMHSSPLYTIHYTFIL
jgi:hypothetical protein